MNLSDVKQKIFELEKKNKDVINYLNLMSEKMEIESNLKRELQKIRRECKHKVKIFINSSRDDYEGRTYVKYKCLHCGAIDEVRSNYIDYFITDNEITEELLLTIYDKITADNLGMSSMEIYDKINKLLNAMKILKNA